MPPPITTGLRTGALLGVLLALAGSSRGQSYNFTSGPIPLCDTSIFTATVTGVGWLVDPNWDWGPYLSNVLINITSDHPQTLKITLTSPSGTTLLLSAFNGAGGQNYTNTNFTYWGGGNITTAAAPFTGNFAPQGGGLSAFNYQNADGVWTITVIDTACVGGGPGPGPGNGWTPGWFDGGTGGGAFAFGFSSPPPPPCFYDLGYNVVYGCPGDVVDMVAMMEGQVGMGTLPLTYYDNFGNTITDPTQINTSGTYYCDGYDWSTDCYYYGTLEFLLYPQVDLGPDQTVNLCGAGATVNLTQLVSGPPGYSYWSFAGASISAAQAASVSTPGVYQLVGSNQGGCSDTALVTVTVGGGALGPDQTVAICPGATADLAVLYPSVGPTATWTFGGTPFATPAQAVQPGVYTISEVDGQGCVAQADVELTWSPVPDLGPDGLIDICSNGTTDLTQLYDVGPGTGTSEWTLDGVTWVMPYAVNVPGVFQLVQTNVAGCSDTAVVTVTVYQAPTLGADQAVAGCVGEEIDLSGLYDTQGLSANWTLGGAAVPDASAVEDGGTYRLVVSTVEDCRDTAFVTVTLHAAPVLGPDQTLSVCPGSPADLTALFPPVVPNASWTFGGQVFGAPEAATVPGIYTLTATDAQGCSDEAQVQLGWAAAPDLGPDGIMDICSNGVADLTTLYDLSTGTAEWTLDGVPWVMPYAVNVPGVFQLVQTNASGCTDTAVVTVTVYQAPSLGPDQVVNGCEGELVDLTGLYATQGLPASWSLGGAAVSDASAVDEGGTYRLVVSTVEDCRDTAFVTITLHAAPVLGEDQVLSVCTGATADLEALYVAGSSTASWTLNGAAVADPGAAEGPGTYQLVLTNGHGCADTLLATIDVLPTPALGADVTVDRCAGDVVDLAALFPLAGLETAWTLNGAPLDTPGQVQWSGTYQLMATNAAGCSDEAVVLLTIQPAPDLGPDLSFTLCPWQTVDLTSVLVLDGLTVDVSLDGALVDPGTPITDAGTYLVVGTNAGGCPDSVWVEVGAVDCLCEADFVHEGACIQDPVAFTVLADSAVVGVRWDFAGAADAITGTAPVVRFSGSTTVQVTMEVTLSCGVVTVQRPIVVPDCSDLCKVYIANAFSPNNDGINDVWSWNGECLPEAMDLVVMDRWGQMVFTSADPLAGWDGTLAGTPVPPGVYSYRMRYRLPYQDERVASGSVTLLR